MVKKRYIERLDATLPMLGFGCMRLPLKEDNYTFDLEKCEEMFDYAMAHGLNYFDTAYSYADGQSEKAVGLLSKYPRESYFITTKLPLYPEYVTYDSTWEDLEKLLDEELLWQLLARTEEKRFYPEIVCTGRNAPKELEECADYLTRMDAVRHPYEKGIGAREGIEY